MHSNKLKNCSHFVGVVLKSYQYRPQLGRSIGNEVKTSFAQTDTTPIWVKILMDSFYALYEFALVK